MLVGDTQLPAAIHNDDVVIICIHHVVILSILFQVGSLRMFFSHQIASSGMRDSAHSKGNESIIVDLPNHCQSICRLRRDVSWHFQHSSMKKERYFFFFLFLVFVLGCTSSNFAFSFELLLFCGTDRHWFTCR